MEWTLIDDSRPATAGQLCWFVPNGELQPSLGNYYPRHEEQIAMASYLGTFKKLGGNGAYFNVSADPIFNMVEKWQSVMIPGV